MDLLAICQRLGAPLGIAKAMQTAAIDREMAAMVLSIRSTGFAQPERLNLNRTFALAAAIAVNLGALLLLSFMGVAPTTRLPVVAPPQWIEIVRPRQIVPPVPAIPSAPVRPETIAQPRSETLPTQVLVPTPTASLVVVDATPVSTQVTTTEVAAPGPAATADREARLAYEFAPPPPYPNIALTREWEGTVMLLVLVAADGGVEEVRVQRGSGHRVLDLEALRHVRQHWRFQPAWRDGQAISAWASVPVVFKLD